MTTATEILSAVAFGMALFSAFLLLALLSRAREDVLGSRVGWRLVAAAMALFALRGFGTFLDVGNVEVIRSLAGILAALLLPSGLYLVLREATHTEVLTDRAGR